MHTRAVVMPVAARASKCLGVVALTALVIVAALLAAPAQARGEGGGSGVLDRLRALAGQEPAEPDFLPVEKAFLVRVTAVDTHTVVADFEPQPGYYLYRDKFAFSLADATGARIAKVELPAGEAKEDPNFGTTEVFHQPVRAVIALERVAPAAQRVTLEARYQGCAEAGLCYPPETRRFELLLAAVDAQAANAGASRGSEPTEGAEAAFATGRDDSAAAASLLASGNFWAIIASFFGFGLLLAFTPCVLPMVPILSGIIVGRGHAVSRRHALGLSLAYVLGMAVTYALAGIAAGMSGTLLTSALQNPWVLGTFALLFVLLALSMFGFYELQIPSALQSRLSEASNRFRGGTLGGVFAMGVLSALIVGPCVAAPLAGALLYINQSRDAALGGSALFAMALGMGAPLLAVGVSAGSLLPRAGQWMETVKQFFGVVLLGLAIWIVSPMLPAALHMLLWAVLLIVSAMYLHALDPLPHNASGYRRLWKGVGVIALLIGVALLVGALSGSRDILQPLSGLRASSGAAPADAPAFERVRSLEELDRAVASARGRPVVLDFYADWCISCKEMERFTFTDAQVRSRMQRMVLLKADVTANSADDTALLRRFGLFGPPGMIFFDGQGRELPQRVIGFQPPAPFVEVLNRVLETAS